MNEFTLIDLLSTKQQDKKLFQQNLRQLTSQIENKILILEEKKQEADQFLGTSEQQSILSQEQIQIFVQFKEKFTNDNKNVSSEESLSSSCQVNQDIKIILSEILNLDTQSLQNNLKDINKQQNIISFIQDLINVNSEISKHYQQENLQIDTLITLFDKISEQKHNITTKISELFNIPVKENDYDQKNSEDVKQNTVISANILENSNLYNDLIQIQNNLKLKIQDILRNQLKNIIISNNNKREEDNIYLTINLSEIENQLQYLKNMQIDSNDLFTHVNDVLYQKLINSEISLENDQDLSIITTQIPENRTISLKCDNNNINLKQIQYKSPEEQIGLIKQYIFSFTNNILIFLDVLEIIQAETEQKQEEGEQQQQFFKINFFFDKIKDKLYSKLKSQDLFAKNELQENLQELDEKIFSRFEKFELFQKELKFLKLPEYVKNISKMMLEQNLQESLLIFKTIKQNGEKDDYSILANMIDSQLVKLEGYLEKIYQEPSRSAEMQQLLLNHFQLLINMIDILEEDLEYKEDFHFTYLQIIVSGAIQNLGKLIDSLRANNEQEPIEDFTNIYNNLMIYELKYTEYVINEINNQ